MTTVTSRSRTVVKANIAVLLGTTSLLGLAGVALAAEPVAAPEEEEVLITGSLIAGAPAVGVPVTSFAQEDFKVTGALTVSEVLQNIPAVNLQGSVARTSNSANTSRTQPIDLHGLDGGSAPRSLLLFNGLRYPPQSQAQEFYDPSIIPALAVGRVDVLVGGASSAYGSDAIAGVVNVILRRNFDGAMTQARISHIEGETGPSWMVSQLFGRTWDTGGITVTYEYYNNSRLKATARPDLYTYDFTPWGLNDLRPLRSSLPGIVSTGAPAGGTTGTSCTNCFSIPQGTGWNYGDSAAHTNPILPGSAATTTWTTLLASKGVTNLANPWMVYDIASLHQRGGVVVTFDQELFDGVSIWVDAFHSNRRSVANFGIESVATTTAFTLTVPTTNPYYPTGAPAGLRVSYNLAKELSPYTTSVATGGRYAGGFNLELPYEWSGRLTYSVSEHQEKAWDTDLANTNNILAALGNTVSTNIAPLAPFSKPANVPYFNPFCDPTVYQCNSKETIDYIRSWRHSNAGWIIHEYQATFDGPVYTLPAGELKVAVGGSYVDDSLYYTRDVTVTSVRADYVVASPDPNNRRFWSLFAQADVPVISQDMMIPMIQEFTLSFGHRYDHFNEFKGVNNSKVSADWVIMDGLSLRGSWAEAFRGPAFSETSPVAGGFVRPLNIVAGAASNGFAACNTVGGAPAAGSAAAILNPTCSSALQFQGGIVVGKNSGNSIRVGLRPSSYALGPETSTNYTLGITIAPAEYVPGLFLDVDYFYNKIDNAIGAGCSDLNNAQCRGNFALVGDPNFDAIVAAAISHPASVIPVTTPASAIKFVQDNGTLNIGTVTSSGLDYRLTYEREFGDWGTFRIGTAGTYYIFRRTDDGVGNIQDPYVGDSTTAGVGNATLARWRARHQVGWTNGTYSATLFANYRSHTHSTDAPPPANVKPANWAQYRPETYYFDLSLGYDTGDAPASTYLKNISVQLVAENLFDRRPPFAYVSGGTNGLYSFDPNYDPIGREIKLTVIKTW